MTSRIDEQDSDVHDIDSSTGLNGVFGTTDDESSSNKSRIKSTTLPRMNLKRFTFNVPRLAYVLIALVILAMGVYALFGVLAFAGVLFVYVVLTAVVLRSVKTREMKKREEKVIEQREREALQKRILSSRNAASGSLSILVANDAGSGGKTTAASCLALGFRDRLKAMPVIIVEGRKASAQGAKRHGLDRSTTTTIREFHQMIEGGKLHNEDGSISNEKILAALTATMGGVFYLQADMHTSKPDLFSVEHGPAELVMQYLQTTGAIILVDSGNSATEPVTMGMANLCHFGVFPTMLKDKSLDLWRDTINNLESANPQVVKESLTLFLGVRSQRSLKRAKQRLMPLPGSSGAHFVLQYDQHLDDEVVAHHDDPDDDVKNNQTKVIEYEEISELNRIEIERVVSYIYDRYKIMRSSASTDPNAS